MAKQKDFFTQLRKKLIVTQEDEEQRRAAGEAPAPLFKERNAPRPFFLAVLFTSLKMLLLAFVVVGFGVLGIGIGVAKAYVETTPSLDVAQLTISDRTSFLYDMNGNMITSLADVEFRDWVNIEDIPDMLQNAFVSVEDVRFYKHSGVDFKRLFSAALEVLGNSNSSGGSTITQQLIKNKILGSQRTYKRKIQEAYLAIEVEKMISKEDILEAYLNDIHLGESNYGVKTAAMDYYGKELAQLTIRECAMLAGMPQNPYTYNPRKNMYQRNKMDVTNARTDLVLSRMYQAGYITEEQYESALTETVYIIPESKQKQMYDYAYFVEFAVRDVVSHLIEQRGLADTSVNRSAVENELRTGGYHIYTTLDPNAQETVQTTLTNWDKYPSLADSSKALSVETNSDGTVIETIEPQAAAVLFDYHTGELRAIVGGRMEPTIRKGINRAYQSYTEVGSAIKPLSVYGPALDMGLAPASIIANMDGAIDGWGTAKGYPAGGLKSRYGPVTVRRGLMSSLNVVAARILMDYVTVDIAAQYLINLGASQSKVNSDGPGLALGTSGLTPIQMAAAYGAIASGGTYREPLSFTKVIDGTGNVILDADLVRDTHRVFKESSAYLLVDMLTDAVKSGTGSAAKIDGMTVAGKTGTNSDYASVYFAGITPYYTSTVWIGHDYPSNKLREGASGGDYAAPLWQAYMSALHDGLADGSIIDADPLALGLTERTVCAVSGKLATNACKDDEEHGTTTDYFNADNMPTEECDMHVTVSVCSESGSLATALCPPETVMQQTYILIRPNSQFAHFDDEYLFKAMPTAVRTDLPMEEFIASLATCTLHSGGSLGVFELKTSAEALIGEVQSFIDASPALSAEMRELLNTDINLLQAALAGYDYTQIEPRYTALQTDYANAKSGLTGQPETGPGEP